MFQINEIESGQSGDSAGMRQHEDSDNLSRIFLSEIQSPQVVEMRRVQFACKQPEQLGFPSMDFSGTGAGEPGTNWFSLDPNPGALDGSGSPGQDLPRQSEAPAMPGQELPPASEIPRSNGHDLPHVGEDIRNLQPDINPRLGCALAVSTALHEQFPGIAITNNSGELERELHAHGYEMVPQNGPITNQSVQDGDVIIGRRPFGMPSHVAMVTENVGSDGVTTPGLYQNDSNTGRIENNGDLDQFNRGMHDTQGHWNPNGFDNVIVLRRAS